MSESSINFGEFLVLRRRITPRAVLSLPLWDGGPARPGPVTPDQSKL